MCMSVTGPNVGELLFRDRLIEMARLRRRLAVRADTCVARRMHYQNCQYPYMQLSVLSRAN